jgi:hypothetical protein
MTAYTIMLVIKIVIIQKLMLPAVLRAHEPGTFHSGFIEFSLPSPITP